MLYTRRGDDGTTKTFGPGKGRISKSSCVAESLGAVDEINSFIGLCKVCADKAELALVNGPAAEFLHFIQGQLFIIQAELAGADKTMEEQSVKELENVTDWIEGRLPPIKTFRIAGGSELAAYFDIARTMARRAERAVIAGIESGKVALGEHSRAFLNRLSSALYAMARYANFQAGVEEEAPTY
jgi:cob(I)alamin adenosyltransferase